MYSLNGVKNLIDEKLDPRGLNEKIAILGSGRVSKLFLANLSIFKNLNNIYNLCLGWVIGRDHGWIFFCFMSLLSCPWNLTENNTFRQRVSSKIRNIKNIIEPRPKCCNSAQKFVLKTAPLSQASNFLLRPFGHKKKNCQITTFCRI